MPPGWERLDWVFVFIRLRIESVNSSFSISQMKFFDWDDFPVLGLGCLAPGLVPPPPTWQITVAWDHRHLRPRSLGSWALLTIIKRDRYASESPLRGMWGERNAVNLAVHNRCACIPVSFYNSQKGPRPKWPRPQVPVVRPNRCGGSVAITMN